MPYARHALAALCPLLLLVALGACSLRQAGGRIEGPAPIAEQSVADQRVIVAQSQDDDLAEICTKLAESDHPQLGRAGLEQARAAVSTLGLDAAAPVAPAALAGPATPAAPATSAPPIAGAPPPPDPSIPARLGLAEELLRQNHLNEAIALLDEVAADTDPNAPPDYRLRRAVTYLRAAETANCLNATNRFLCILSRDREGAYVDQNYSLAAIADLEALLRVNPHEITAKWLLNIAHMTLGSYPDGVPLEWRIPPEAFASEHDAPRFVNLAPDLGVAAVNLVGGAVMDDFDGDGLLDLFSTSYHPCEHVLLYHNNGDGTFSDRSAAAGLDRQLGGINTVQVDYDNDGHLDLMIIRGGWQFDHGRHRRSLVRNNGDGTFSDVTHAAGLAGPAYPNHAAAWADYDLDGDLDFYSANEAGQAGPFPSQLFRNNGDGTFTDVAPAAGVTNDIMAKGAGWGDYDNDGDPDLYVSNIGPNRLYRNNGDSSFVDVAPALGVTEPAGRSFSTWFWDYDNDGWLDLFVAGYSASVEQVAMDTMGGPASTGPATGEYPRLYRNDGRGGFEDVTLRVGLDRFLLPMGSNFGDIDNDGWEDIYLGTGSPAFAALMPNVMFWNEAGRRFRDVTMAAGVGHLPKGHGIAFGDLDNDGDQDIYLQAGGFYPSDVSPNALFENPGTPNHWLTVKLHGTRANRAAIGARLKAVVQGPDGERAIHRLVGTGSSYGANSLQAEIGLGAAERVERLEVTWPGNPEPQVWESIAADQAIEIVEGEPGYYAPERPAVRLFRVGGEAAPASP